jgi:hypothetical protein
MTPILALAVEDRILIVLLLLTFVMALCFLCYWMGCEWTRAKYECRRVVISKQPPLTIRTRLERYTTPPDPEDYKLN